MANLIDKQAAINAFEKRTHIDWESLKILHPMFEVLEELPSVELEPAIPISWVEKEIKHLESYGNSFAMLTASQLKALIERWRLINQWKVKQNE